MKYEMEVINSFPSTTYRLTVYVGCYSSHKPAILKIIAREKLMTDEGYAHETFKTQPTPEEIQKFYADRKTAVENRLEELIKLDNTIGTLLEERFAKINAQIERVDVKLWDRIKDMDQKVEPMYDQHIEETNRRARAIVTSQNKQIRAELTRRNTKKRK